MKNTKHNGFTMIELIFVIVILGILAAIAIPKLLGTQRSAKAQIIESFVGTVNRTTFPSMYVSALRDTGSIKTMTLSDYITLPKEVSAINIANCGAGTFALVDTTDLGAKIYCRDGNSSSLPALSFSSTDLNTTLDKQYYK